MKSRKNTLSAVLIVKNEAINLDECLQSINGWVDEIIILDSGSTDSTEEISRKYTEHFYLNENWPGFGKQRQIAQNYVTSDYVFWLDADERVSPLLKKNILEAVNSDINYSFYSFNRLSSAFGKFIHHSGWSPDWIVRLYRCSEARYDDALVHEKVIVPPNGKVIKLPGFLYHHTYDDLHHYLGKTTKYLKAWADEREGYKKSGLGKAIIHAFSIFFKMYFLKLGFLDGRHGFILAWLAMNSTFLKYIDLYLREQRSSK